MLILERRVGEGIMLDLDGVEVEVKLVKITDGRARIGIIPGKRAVMIEKTDENGDVIAREKEKTA